MESANDNQNLYTRDNLKMIFDTLIHKYALDKPAYKSSEYSRITLSGPYNIPSEEKKLMTALNQFLRNSSRDHILYIMIQYRDFYVPFYFFNEGSKVILFHHNLPDELNLIIEPIQSEVQGYDKELELYTLISSQASIPVEISLYNLEEICKFIESNRYIDREQIYEIMNRDEIDIEITDLRNRHKSYLATAIQSLEKSSKLPRPSIANSLLKDLQLREDIDSFYNKSQTYDFLDNFLSSSLYVDKTMFIRKVLNTKSFCTIITRPPGWGKTVNLHTLRIFLSNDLREKDISLREKFFKNLKLAQGFPSYPRVTQKLVVPY